MPAKIAILIAQKLADERTRKIIITIVAVVLSIIFLLVAGLQAIIALFTITLSTFLTEDTSLVGQTVALMDEARDAYVDEQMAEYRQRTDRNGNEYRNVILQWENGFSNNDKEVLTIVSCYYEQDWETDMSALACWVALKSVSFSTRERGPYSCGGCMSRKEQDAKQRAVHYATAERYAKVIASAIIGNTGSVNSGDSSEYFNETARGLITGLVLLVSQYGQDGERHIVSVFNLIVELAGADNPEKGNTVQKSRLAAMLEGVTDRRIKGYISTTTSADIRTTLNIVSSALSKLLKFVDAELEQLICTHDNDLDAERFIERPTAIFLIAPDENETRHFLASLFVRFLTDDLIALAERQGGHCPRPFYYFLDEFGNFPAIPGVTSLFSAIRSRGGRILVAVQSYSQFLLKYDKNVTEIIKDNCQILLNTFVSPSAQDTATSISKMLGDETILTGSSSRSDGKTTSSHQLMGRPLMSPAQMVRIQRDTWIVEKAGYAPMKTHLEGYWKYLSLAPQEQDATGENDYLEIKLLSTESLRQALGSAPARPHTPPAATREPRRKLGASRREAAALYPGKFNP